MIYLYGILPGGGEIPPGKANGVDGHPLLVRSVGGIRIGWSEVDDTLFRGAEAEQNLQDAEWVTARAVEHERAMETLTALGPVFPLRFATLFSGEEALERFLVANSDRFHEFWAEVEGAGEWAVKGVCRISAVEKKLVAERLQKCEPDLHTKTQGIVYLKERQMLLQVRRELPDLFAETAEAVAREVGEAARRQVERPVYLKEESGGEETVVFSIAFLVPNDRKDPFFNRVDEASAKLRLPETRLTRSGPWPAYSFCPDLVKS